MHSLSRFLIMPLTIFWIILLLGIVFYIFKRKRSGLIFGLLSIFWLTMISLPFLPSMLVKSLENRFPPLFETSQVPQIGNIYILVLGGEHSEDKNLPPVDQLSLNSLCRLAEGLRLHRILPGSCLVFSGISRGQKYSHAEILSQAALSMGIAEKEIILLPTSENTRMEALDYTRKFGTNTTLVLVTDAIHMPRAMFLFQKAGQKPIPAPTNHLVKSKRKQDISDWGPSAFNIIKMEYAMHEIFGLAWAKAWMRSRGE